MPIYPMQEEGLRKRKLINIRMLKTIVNTHADKILLNSHTVDLVIRADGRTWEREGDWIKELCQMIIDMQAETNPKG